MVLPNVTQLYFRGKIELDAMTMQPRLGSKQSKQVYDILERPATTDLETELANENLEVNDDMILLEVGQKLMEEKKTGKALLLYKYYTKTFPNIVVAWNDLGDIYQLLKNKEEAIKCYEQALKIRPSNVRAKESLKQVEAIKIKKYFMKIPVKYFYKFASASKQYSRKVLNKASMVSMVV